jgi:hypothetical protein
MKDIRRGSLLCQLLSLFNRHDFALVRRWHIQPESLIHQKSGERRGPGE